MQQNIKATVHKPRVESTPCKRVGMTVVGVVVRAYRVPTSLVRFEIQFVLDTALPPFVASSFAFALAIPPGARACQLRRRRVAAAHHSAPSAAPPPPSRQWLGGSLPLASSAPVRLQLDPDHGHALITAPGLGLSP